jgi:hypothetical protein
VWQIASMLIIFFEAVRLIASLITILCLAA